ncbi:hypothetical protein SISNIDRAFT_448998 [Sistotremastrum niveocremeum HHB9708]|uniref:RPEL repeat protein n=1 Tax=Sistotremastrum niveocremeum HHB9708 TaxID=1314777 RepID=A0A165AAJ0_9AGAM|nr:hypothetical protein SISNIDRAFT_448998 [Sistotremastrum niveocremeum HHB9708]
MSTSTLTIVTHIIGRHKTDNIIVPIDNINTNVAQATSPISPQDKEKLERRLSERPDKRDLVDRNILRDSTVAPALQAAQSQLQRSQLQDKLDRELQSRPKPEELIQKGILSEDEAPVSA